MKVAVCTLCINDWYQEIVKYGVETIKNYAVRHDYDFYICNDVYDGQRDYPWYKIRAIQKILHKYDYVFWIDADGHVLKPELSIKYFIENYLNEKDLLCAKDWNNTLNTGVMVIKNTPFIHSLLYEVWNNKEEFDKSFHEQASMSEIYISNRLNSQKHIEIIPWERQYILYNFWPNYFPDKQFFIHIARCAHDPLGFLTTLDVYCPIKMSEDIEGEYEDRMSWMSDIVKCRRDTENCMNKIGMPRMSSRALKYREKINLQQR
jgi:hypothetical protein